MTGRKITIELGELDWNVVLASLTYEAGEIAANEARRTGGRGYSNGGKHSAVEHRHRIFDTIAEKVNEARKSPEIVR